MRVDDPYVIARAMWGDCVADLSDEDRERAKRIKGCLAGFSAHYLRLRLTAPLVVNGVEIPPAHESILWLLEGLEAAAQGKDSSRTRNTVDAIEALAKHSEARPLCPLQLGLAVLVESNEGNPALPWEAAKIQRWIDEKWPGSCPDLPALHHAMKAFGVTAKPRDAHAPKPRLPPLKNGKRLRGLELARWALDAEAKKRPRRLAKRADG
jgi:hypothetical protein